MGLFSRDTPARVERIQIGVYRSLSPEQRYAIAVDMSDEMRDLALAGLRARHPGMSQGDLVSLYVRDVLGWHLPPHREAPMAR